MRIIAGWLKGMNFEPVPGHKTHPMSEKMRGAIFNALGDVEDLTVLDAYGGTGALSFEAISRGAKNATILEADPKANSVINKNIEKLGLSEKIKSSRIYAHAWSRRNQSKMFDILLLDPPYDEIVPKDLLALSKHAKKEGLIVLSLPPGSGFMFASSKQELVSTKSHGDGVIYFYRQI